MPTKSGRRICACGSSPATAPSSTASRSASIGQKLGNALTQNRGQPLHVAGSLAVDRWQGTERVQLRVLDVAVPDQGPAVIR